MQKMPIPEWKWQCITMDFVTKLPLALSKYDSVWVIVDRLTKYAYFLPDKTSYNAKQLARIYIHEIVRLHWILVSIMSNKGSLFAS